MNTPFIDQLTDYVSCLEWTKRSTLSFPLHWVVLTNGGALFDDNVILFGFEDRRHNPTFVAKVPRLRKSNRTLQNEYDRLSELWDQLGSNAAFHLPEPVGLATLQKQPALIITYVDGENVMQGSKEKTWQHSRAMATLAVDAARSLRFFNRQTAAPLNGQRLKSDLELKAEKFRQLYTLTERELRALEDLVTASRSAWESATHKVMNQGDFWSGNMIRSAQDGRLIILDWQFAHWSVDVSLDLYLFLLDGALTAVQDAPREKRASRAAEVLSSWREDVLPAYMDTYGKPEGYVLLPPRFGMMLCCVEKSIRTVLDFGFHHPNDVIWRELFTEVMDWVD